MATYVWNTVERWDLELRRAEQVLVPGEILKLQRKLVFLTLGAAVEIGGRYRRISGVIFLTPVDTGRARASWNVSVGRPNRAVPAARRYRSRANPDSITARAAPRLARLGPFDTVWITSSLPYISVLEYGGYPDPVKHGTYVKRLRGHVVRSEKGFSKQAPRGMVRVTVGGVTDLLRAA